MRYRSLTIGSTRICSCSSPPPRDADSVPQAPADPQRCVRDGRTPGLGGPGWLPTQGSRRPGRARLTHPVPLVMDSLPKGIRGAIRWCYVDMDPGRQCRPRRGLPRAICLSRLNHTALTLAVYASQHRLPGHHARLASGCRPALPDGSGYPLGSIERFLSSVLCHLIPLSQAFVAQGP